MPHVHVKITVKLMPQTPFATLAAGELGLVDKFDVELHPDTGRAIAALIEDRARNLERDAALAAEEERRRQELEEHGT